MVSASSAMRDAASGPDLAASEAKAKQMVDAAKAAAEATKVSSEENVKFVPLAKGEASEALVAAKTAQDALTESESIIKATTAEANEAAMEAAKAYMLEVK